MKKHLFMFFLAFALAIAGCPVMADATEAVFRVNAPPELPLAGDTFEVVVELDNNPGFSAIQFELDYDEEKMTCLEVLKEELLDGMISATNPDSNGSAIFSAVSLSMHDGDGAVATFVFEAIEDIEKFDVKLINITFADADLNDLDYKIVYSPESDGDTAEPDGETAEPDGDTAEPDGETAEPDGGITEPDGEITEPDGVITEPDGEATEPDEDVSLDDEKDESFGSNTEKPSSGANTNTESETKEELSENEQPDFGTEPEQNTEDVIVLFSDVRAHWAESFINEAAKLGLFKGDDKGCFNPDDNVTRAQFVTVLWRMAGSPETNTDVPFSDVDDQIDEFKSAIAWGYANGYINGTSETTFDPTGTLTREAGMKILHYYSGGKTGGEMLLTAVYDGTFEDSSQISDWAKPSVYWGIYQKLISGTSESTLSPQGTASRAQLAKILVNYINFIQEK